MVSIRGDEEGPILKPLPKIKGGRKPKDTGRRYERSFAQKYGGKRVVGSGAFGVVDPGLVGDVVQTVGDLDMLLELKSLNRLDGRGEKTITFPVAWLEKIDREATSVGKVPGFVYHVKGSPQEYIVLRFDWFKELIEEYVRQISEWEENYYGLLEQVGGVTPG